MEIRREPIVIAHRGASGYLPEHTLEAYALAIALGADFIEPDLVATADGALVARHENELAASTDVASRPGFAGRFARKRVDGVEREGWFSEDFSLAEIRSLHAREPRPLLRPESARHDGRYRVPSFDEIVALARDAGVGLYPETKSPSWFAREGRRIDGTAIGVSLGRLVIATLQRMDFIDPARVFIQSFEVGNLVELAREIMPAAGLRLPLVQLFGREGAVPYDLRGRARSSGALRNLAQPMPGVLGSRERLSMIATYADAIGLPRVLASDSLLADAQAEAVAVHAFTYRAEDFVDAAACAREVANDFRRGVAGVFIDQPDLVDRASEQVRASARNPHR